MHIIEDYYSKKITIFLWKIIFFNSRHTLFILLLMKLIFIIYNIITLYKSLIEYPMQLAIIWNNKIRIFIFACDYLNATDSYI